MIATALENYCLWITHSTFPRPFKRVFFGGEKELKFICIFLLDYGIFYNYHKVTDMVQNPCWCECASISLI